MRATPDETAPRPAAGWARVRRALGVSRVARITRLDRTGVEVASAIRPGGHVLQVTNGKGLTFAQAAAGALLEAAELAAAERVSAAELRWASPGQLAEARVPFLWPGPIPGPAGVPIAWRQARDVGSGHPLLVPAAAIHVPPPGGPALGLVALRWTSNGMGAHPVWHRALLHALLEAIERDVVARALPDGWTEAAVLARRVPDALLRRHAAALAALVAAVERGGFEVHLFALEASHVGPHVAGALLFDAADGPVPLTAGYACRLHPEAALLAALLEAAQSRLTDIHGAREDVSHAPPRGLARLRQACARARARPQGRGGLGSARAWRRTSGDPRREVATALGHLRARGHRACAALDLAGPELGLHVAKVIVPGLLVSELL